VTLGPQRPVPSSTIYLAKKNNFGPTHYLVHPPDSGVSRGTPAAATPISLVRSSGWQCSGNTSSALITSVRQASPFSSVRAGSAIVKARGAGTELHLVEAFVDGFIPRHAALRICRRREKKPSSGGDFRQSHGFISPLILD
jgi:hypothetical protein